MTATAIDRLRVRVERFGPLCIGIDPHPDALPGPLSRDVRGVEALARGLVEVAIEEAAAVKLNIAFFEAHGSAGWAALERVRAAIPAELPCIVDAKRGDIGPSAERYASAIFDHLGADGVTVSPYLGADAVAPFTAYGDRIVYVLARTSNPSAGTFQDRLVGDAPLHELVASWVADTWPEPRVGLVVGPPHRPSWSGSASWFPRPRSSSPGWAPRAATSRQRPASAARRRRPGW